VCWKWGDWRNWKKYYPTILYIIVFSLFYEFLTQGYPLWRLDHPLLKNTFSVIVVSFIIFPATLMLYLPYQDKKIYKRMGFYLLWVLIYSIIEFSQYKLGNVHYFNGWNYGYSVLFDFGLFLAVRLHYKYPLITDVISVFTVPIVLALFSFPFESVS